MITETPHLMTAQFRPVSWSAYRVSEDRAAIILTDSDVPIVVDTALIDILTLCGTCRSLDDHADSIVRAGCAHGDRTTIREHLQYCVQLGLLAPLNRPGGPVVSSSALPHSPITTIAIATAGRPVLLARCLGSLHEHCRRSGSRPRLLIVDGSGRAEDETANRSIARRHEQHGAVGPITFIGHAERDSIRDVMADALPQHDVDGGLALASSDYSLGASRNLILLLTAGEKLLLLDDDVIVSPWALSDADDRLTLHGHGDPRVAAFFLDRVSAFAAVSATDVSLLAAHERLLGRTLSSLYEAAGDDIDVSHGCSHLLDAATSSDTRSHVRWTLSGVAGDAAIYCPYQRLFARGPVREQLGGGRASCDTALTTREVVEAVARPTVAHSSQCIGYCMGLDNRTMVPPFTPYWRNSDGVFGTSLLVCDPGSFPGYVPVGILHDSARPSRYREVMPSARQIRVSELLSVLIRLWPSSTIAHTPDVRLRRLGQYLLDLATLPAPQFSHLATLVMMDHLSGALRDAADQLAAGKHAEHVASPLRAYCATLMSHLQQPRFFVPVEYATGGGWESVQAYVRRVGAVFASWPDIWQCARTRLRDATFVL